MQADEVKCSTAMLHLVSYLQLLIALLKAGFLPAVQVGMHFMNPVPVMKLVELIRGMQTSDEVMLSHPSPTQTTQLSADSPCQYTCARPGQPLVFGVYALHTHACKACAHMTCTCVAYTAGWLRCHCKFTHHAGSLTCSEHHCNMKPHKITLSSPAGTF